MPTTPTNPTTPVSSHIEDLLERLSLEEKASLTAAPACGSCRRSSASASPPSRRPTAPRASRREPRRAPLAVAPLRHGHRLDLESRARRAALARCLPSRHSPRASTSCSVPTVCIPRTPLGGRTFECFWQTPGVFARIAVADVRGVQPPWGGLLHQHYACNDEEHERTTDQRGEVDERALWEIHLVAFEAAVQEADVWSVMTA